MIAHFVRNKERPERFGQASDVLRHVDERDSQIPGSVQDRQSERADQNDVACRGGAALPQDNRPRQQADRQHDRDERVEQPQLFEVDQAPPPRRGFTLERGIEPAMLAAHSAKRTHQRQVGDDIAHLAVDRRRLVGEVVMQGSPGRGATKHRDNHQDSDHHQCAGNSSADRQHECNRPDRRGARREHVPNEHVLHRKGGVRRRRDTACQHPGLPLEKIAWCMSGDMAKQVAAQVAGHADEGRARYPAGEPPQQIVESDQRRQEGKCNPCQAGIRPPRQCIDQKFDAILAADRAGDCAQDGSQNNDVRPRRC